MEKPTQPEMGFVKRRQQALRRRRSKGLGIGYSANLLVGNVDPSNGEIGSGN
jgi:hypothetical protein